MIHLVNKVLTKPRVRGKTHHKTSLYSKLEKASMLIGTAGLLGGVIGPVIAPAEEVLAVSRSEMQKRAKQGASGGKAAPHSKKTGGKGSSGSKSGKAPNKLDPYLGKNPKLAEEKGHSKIIILLADDIHGR